MAVRLAPLCDAVPSPCFSVFESRINGREMVSVQRRHLVRVLSKHRPLNRPPVNPVDRSSNGIAHDVRRVLRVEFSVRVHNDAVRPIDNFAVHGGLQI